MKKIALMCLALLAVFNYSRAEAVQLSNNERALQQAWLTVIREKKADVISDVIRNIPFYRDYCATSGPACSNLSKLGELMASARDEHGRTPMMLAVRNGLSALFDWDYKPRSIAHELTSQARTGSARFQDYDGKTVWDHVLENEDKETRTAMANDIAYMPESHLCAGGYEYTQELGFTQVKKDLKTCILDENGNTALHLAAPYLKQHKTLGMINDAPVGYVNVQNNDGDTPLHAAAKAGNCRCYLALYTHPETDRSILNNDGKTAIEIMDEKVKGATCLFKIAIRVLHEWEWNRALAEHSIEERMDSFVF